jgi:hypothetical protein
MGLLSQAQLLLDQGQLQESKAMLTFVSQTFATSPDMTNEENQRLGELGVAVMLRLQKEEANPIPKPAVLTTLAVESHGMEVGTRSTPNKNSDAGYRVPRCSDRQVRSERACPRAGFSGRSLKSP